MITAHFQESLPWSIFVTFHHPFKQLVGIIHLFALTLNFAKETVLISPLIKWLFPALTPR